MNWVAIATNIANTGSYAWSVPSVDSSLLKIRLTARDSYGNTASGTSIGNNIIDKTVPSVGIAYAGGGGTTPQNGKYINNSGIDLTVGATDAHLDKVYYQFADTTNNLCWNASFSAWMACGSYNLICSDGQAV